MQFKYKKICFCHIIFSTNDENEARSFGLKEIKFRNVSFLPVSESPLSFLFAFHVNFQKKKKKKIHPEYPPSRHLSTSDREDAHNASTSTSKR